VELNNCNTEESIEERKGSRKGAQILKGSNDCWGLSVPLVIDNATYLEIGTDQNIARDRYF
jgi:hypothetical protein